MTNEKQYFDSLELSEGYIWAVDKIKNTKTPLEIHRTSYSVPSYNPAELVIQQKTGGWWYSRKKFNTEESIKQYLDEIQKLIKDLDAEKRVG